MTVLLVDDSPTMRRIVAGALRTNGHTVIEAGDGAEAVEKTEKTHFDVVITDVMMPHVNGFALAQQLRTRRPQLPMIFMSGFAVDHTLIGDHAAFLLKPFRAEDLLKKMASVTASAAA